MLNCEVTKNVVFGYSCRYTVYYTQNNNHLEQNIGIIWHKRRMFVSDNTTEYNVSQKKKKLSRNYPRWPYRHDKPACRLLKTSQESREWLISLKQSHRVVISSSLSHSQKECETKPSREENNAAVFANRMAEKKIRITSLTEVTAVSTTNLRHKRKMSLPALQML